MNLSIHLKSRYPTNVKVLACTVLKIISTQLRTDVSHQNNIQQDQPDAFPLYTSRHLKFKRNRLSRSIGGNIGLCIAEIERLRVYPFKAKYRLVHPHRGCPITTGAENIPHRKVGRRKHRLTQFHRFRPHNYNCFNRNVYALRKSKSVARLRAGDRLPRRQITRREQVCCKSSSNRTNIRVFQAQFENHSNYLLQLLLHFEKHGYSKVKTPNCSSFAKRAPSTFVSNDATEPPQQKVISFV